MDNMKHRRLQELDHSDFEIAKNECDIRGWDVRTAEGQKIGEVEELIIDAQQKKVRYMIVDLDKNDLGLQERKVLIPIGIANLHEKNDDVILPQTDISNISALPEYDRDGLDADTEKKICNTLGRKPEAMPHAEGLHSGFYHHEYYNDDNLYKTRMQETQKEESEFERGLKLWEKWSEGGILPEHDGTYRGKDRASDPFKNSEIPEASRMEMVKNRRNSYEERRIGSSGQEDFNTGNKRKHGSIQKRIRDEGLRDA